MSSGGAEAILLDVADLGDGDRVVTFLTAHTGKKRGVARGARRKYSRFSGQLQPLAKARISWFEKEGRDLVRVTGVDLLRPAAALQGDLEGILLGSYMVDHMLVFAQENEVESHHYRLLDATTEALLAGVDRNLAARYFEIWVLRLAGIFPPPRDCPRCGRTLGADESAVLPPDGEAILCEDCAGPLPAADPRRDPRDDPRPADGSAVGAGALRVPPAVLELLRRSGRENLARLDATPPSPAVLDQVAEVCARVRRSFLGRELKSYEVIRRTLKSIRF